MNRKLLLIGLIVSALLVPGLALGGATHCTLTHDGIERDYYVYRPVGYDKLDRLPVVFVIHGGTGSAERTMLGVTGGFMALADEEGFLAVYPNGYPDRPGAQNHHWNDGRKSFWAAFRKNIDDLGFFRAMIEKLVAGHKADPARIYATGASNGGMMTQRLALELSGQVAAACSVIANMPLELLIKGPPAPKRPVSIMFINGTQDPLMPYGGGTVTTPSGEGILGQVLSAPQTLEFWMNRNGGCEGGKKAYKTYDEIPDDGTSVLARMFTGCAGGSEMALYEVKGGGHTWPGQEMSQARQEMVGAATMEIDAVRLAWEFFKRHEIRQ